MPALPVETVIVLAFVIGMFATFAAALGGVWIWTNLPDRPARTPRPAVRATPATAAR